jgi:hypothetical protein
MNQRLKLAKDTDLASAYESLRINQKFKEHIHYLLAFNCDANATIIYIVHL